MNPGHMPFEVMHMLIDLVNSGELKYERQLKDYFAPADPPERFCSLTLKLVEALPDGSCVIVKYKHYTKGFTVRDWRRESLCKELKRSDLLYRTCKVYRDFDHYSRCDWNASVVILGMSQLPPGDDGEFQDCSYFDLCDDNYNASFELF